MPKRFGHAAGHRPIVCSTPAFEICCPLHQPLPRVSLKKYSYSKYVIQIYNKYMKELNYYEICIHSEQQATIDYDAHAHVNTPVRSP